MGTGVAHRRNLDEVYNPESTVHPNEIVAKAKSN